MSHAGDRRSCLQLPPLHTPLPAHPFPLSSPPPCRAAHHPLVPVSSPCSPVTGPCPSVLSPVTPATLPLPSAPCHFFRGPFLTKSDPRGSSCSAWGYRPLGCTASRPPGTSPNVSPNDPSGTQGHWLCYKTPHTTPPLGSGGGTPACPLLNSYLLSHCSGPGLVLWALKWHFGGGSPSIPRSAHRRALP